MGVNAMRRIFYGAVIGMTGMALAAPFSSVGAGAASTVTVYAPATVGVVAPTTGPSAGCLEPDGSSHAARRTRHDHVHEHRRSRGRHDQRPGGGGGRLVGAQQLQRNEQQRQPQDQLQSGVRAAGPGAVRRQRLRARAGELGVPDLQDERQDPRRADQRQRSLRSGIDAVHQRSALLLRPDHQHMVRDHPLPQRRRGGGRQVVAARDRREQLGQSENIWTQYEVDTTNAGGHGCPCFGDQPTLGIDQDNLYVTTNEFSILGPQFNGAQVYAFSKKDLVAGVPAHFAHFSNLNIGGTLAASVQPAISTGTSERRVLPQLAGFPGRRQERHERCGSPIGVWAMTNRTALQHGGSPMLSSTVITSETYGQPPGCGAEGRDEHSSTRATIACSRRSTSTARSGVRSPPSVNDPGDRQFAPARHGSASIRRSATTTSAPRRSSTRATS